MNELELMGLKDVKKYTTLSCATIYRLIDSGDFPKGQKITRNRRVWLKPDVVEAVEKMLKKYQE